MSKKTCVKCKIEKPISEFYEQKKMADGHLNICKQCTRDRVLAHRAANLEKVQAYDRERGQDPDRKKANRDRYRQIVKTETGRKRMRAYAKDWAEKNALKRAAHVILNNALRDGKVIKKSCEKPGCSRKKKTEAHHDDYTKPLDVVWLCKKHHGERHRELNEQGRDPDA